MEKVNIKQKLNSFSETWVPKIVGELNGQHVKVVKFEDEYVWHHHAERRTYFQLRFRGNSRPSISNSTFHSIRHRCVRPPVDPVEGRCAE